MNVKSGDFIRLNRDVSYRDWNSKEKRLLKAGSIHEVHQLQNNGFVISKFTGFFQDEYDLYIPDLENK